jgi:hypothetical protein
MVVLLTSLMKEESRREKPEGNNKGKIHVMEE